jgi:methyl acetate hydrolase
MTSDHVFALYSTTKAITGAVIMQQVEQGKLSLDEPAKKYVPEIAEIEVLEGFDADGEPIVRAPKSDITTRQLLAHTAGFGYDFYNRDLIEYHRKRNVPSTATGTNASLRSVLLFDPGERWEYGINIDWAGKVAEAVDGERLADIMRERILAPLGMNDTAFALNDAMRARRATIHQRRDDGSMKALSKFELPADPEHGRPRTLRHRGRLHEVHPHDPERRDGTARPRPFRRNGSDHGPQSSRRQEDQDAPERDSQTHERRRVLPRHAKIVGSHLHDQR